MHEFGLKLAYQRQKLIEFLLASHNKLAHERLQLVKLLPAHRTLGCYLGLANLKDDPAIKAIE